MLGREDTEHGTAAPAPQAELGQFGRQASEIICSPKTVPQTSFTSLGLSTKFPSHPKFLIPSEGVGKRQGVSLSQGQANKAIFLPSNHLLWWHQNDLCSSLLRPWAGILKEAAGCHSFQGGPQVHPKFRKSAGNKENQSALRLGDGQSPTSGLQIGFPGSLPQVTQATSGGAPCWLKAVQVRVTGTGARHLHGRSGLGVASLQ